MTTSSCKPLNEIARSVLALHAKSCAPHFDMYVITPSDFLLAVSDYIKLRNQSMLDIIEGDSSAIDYHTEYKNTLSPK